jgi:predicted ATPase/transcriptional regulator with XRE-family HTH domain
MGTTNEPRTFGRFLRQQRLAASLTQEALAERAGLGLRSVQALESGTRLPLRDTLEALAQALELVSDQRRRFTSAAQPVPRRRNRPVSTRDERPRDLADGQVLRVPNNLPIQWTSFVGREQSMSDVLQHLESTPLLTLTGTGGCGKTRLAIEVAKGRLDRYPDGVWLIELAPLTDPTRIAQTTAATLGVREVFGEPILQTLTQHLRAKRVFLVFDNCEHVIDGAAEVVDALLRSCPQVRVLATSREALRISGEVSWRVPSLAVPTANPVLPFEDVIQNESARLFSERAQAGLPGFAVTSQNAAAVGQICRQLDGIPLALELAAARLKGLSVEQLASRLDQSFRLLTGGSRVALPRQQTLAALVGWSYDLLNEPERKLFNRLAVFVGGFTLEAAEGVCTGGAIDKVEVLGLLLRLVEKSPVVAEPSDGGVHRYRLLETLRQYAREQLAASGEVETLHGRHAAYYLELAEQAGSELDFYHQSIWYTRIQLELYNIQAALGWAMESGDVERALGLCGALSNFLYNRAQPGESRRWLAELLAAPAAARPTVGRGRALLSAARLAWGHLDLDQADALLDEALAILRACADQRGIVWALELKANVRIERGAYTSGGAIAAEALAIAQTMGDAGLVAGVVGAIAIVHFYLGDYPAARAHFEQWLASVDSTDHLE